MKPNSFHNNKNSGPFCIANVADVELIPIRVR